MEIDFKKMQGMVPAVIQDADTAELLMVGFMNREAFNMTMRSRLVTFYSRTKQKLWTKGETSGNRLQVVAAWTDCDRDTILFRVRVQGEGKVCHKGTRSCFTEQLPLGTAAFSPALFEDKAGHKPKGKDKDKDKDEAKAVR